MPEMPISQLREMAGLPASDICRPLLTPDERQQLIKSIKASYTGPEKSRIIVIPTDTELSE